MKKIIIALILLTLFSCANTENKKITDIKSDKNISIENNLLDIPLDFKLENIKTYFKNKEILESICFKKNQYFEKYGEDTIKDLCKKLNFYKEKKYLNNDYYVSFNSDFEFDEKIIEKHIFLKYNVLRIYFNFKDGKNVKISDFKYDGKILKKGENKFIIYPKVSKEHKLYFPKLEFSKNEYDFKNIKIISYLGKVDFIKKDLKLFNKICNNFTYKNKFLEKYGKTFINNLCKKEEKNGNKKFTKSDLEINYSCEMRQIIKGKRYCFFNEKSRASQGIFLDINKKFKITEKDFIFKKEKNLFGGRIKAVGNYNFILFPIKILEGKKIFPKFTLKGIDFEFDYEKNYNKKSNILVYNELCKNKETIEINNEKSKYRGAIGEEFGKVGEIKWIYDKKHDLIKDFCKYNIEFKK